MRRMLVATLAVVFLFAGPAPKQSNETEIQKRLDEFAAAWNAHDAKAMAALFAADADVMNPTGRMSKGRAEIEANYETDHTTGINRMATFKMTGPASIRFIEPEIALVDVDADVTGAMNPDGSMDAARRSHITRVMKKSGGKWWIVASRAMRFAPPPAPAK
jgi:uncharacterized protein (TIGR02246 family)